MNDWLSEVNRYASEGTSKLLIGEGSFCIALSGRYTSIELIVISSSPLAADVLPLSTHLVAYLR